MIISLGLLYFNSEANLLLDRYVFTRTFTRLVGFHSDGKLFTRISRLKTQPDLDLPLQVAYDLGLREILYEKRSLDKIKLFRVEGFPIQGRLDGRITRATYQTSVWHLAPYFRWGSVCSVLPLTFAYELGLRWFIYQNQSFRRDEDNPYR